MRDRWVAGILVGFIAVTALLSSGCASCCFGGGGKKSQRLPEAPEGASVFVARVSSSIDQVAVMPFQASTELIGISVSDLFVTELLRAGRYQLVERSQLSQVLNETEIALSGISEARAMELGAMLGADGVVIGTVDEYGTIAHRGRNRAVVGLSVRLIDSQTGRVMWTASYAATARDHRTPLSQHARAVVSGTMIALRRQWHVQRKVPRESAGSGFSVQDIAFSPTR